MDVSSAKMIGAGLAMIAALGAGIGLGNIFSSWLTALARNPAAKDKFDTIGYIGAGMTEAIALFALGLGFVILFQ